MPHTPSAKKRLRKSNKRRLHNRATLRDIKTQLKTIDEVVKSGDTAKLTTEARLAMKKLDKAAARRVVHPNMAARKKSQLARMLNTKKA